MRVFETDKAIVKRLVDNGSTENRSSVVGTIRGFLKPSSTETLAINGIQAGVGFSFFSKLRIDVETTDIIEVNTVEYVVRSVNIEPTSAGYYELVLEKAVKS